MDRAPTEGRFDAVTATTRRDLVPRLAVGAGAVIAMAAAARLAPPESFATLAWWVLGLGFFATIAVDFRLSEGWRRPSWTAVFPAIALGAAIVIARRRDADLEVKLTSALGTAVWVGGYVYRHVRGATSERGA